MKNNYKHAIVIGTDGMGNFNAEASTPRMDEIFGNSAVTYSALSMDPTISAENWGAMLLGATPVVHGLTNSIIGKREYHNDALPSVFRRIRKAVPDACLASYCNWNPINHGIVEHDLGVDLQTADDDIILTDKIVDCVAKKPMFLFVQLDDIDQAGHAHGYGTPEYLEKITDTDALIGKIYDAYCSAGIIEDTLFIVMSDHGGYKNGHGGYTDGEKYVFLGASGHSVPKGEIGFARTKDIASIVLYSLGLDLPEYDENGFSSQIPDGIFPEINGSYRLVKGKAFEPETKNTPDFNASNGLSAFFGMDKIRLAVFFDNAFTDASGKCNITEHGLVKYYSGGVYGSRGELGATGFGVVNGITFGENSFTVAAWIKTDRSIIEALPVCGNKSWWWKDRNENGFVLALRCNDTLMSIGNGNDSIDIVTPFPDEISDGWIHTLVAVDKAAGELRVYYNFRLSNTVRLEEKFLGSYDNAAFTVGNDGACKFNNEIYNIIFNMDDLLVFDGAFTDADAQKLSRYYGIK